MGSGGGRRCSRATDHNKATNEWVERNICARQRSRTRTHKKRFSLPCMHHLCFRKLLVQPLRVRLILQILHTTSLPASSKFQTSEGLLQRRIYGTRHLYTYGLIFYRRRYIDIWMVTVSFRLALKTRVLVYSKYDLTVGHGNQAIYRAVAVCSRCGRAHYAWNVCCGRDTVKQCRILNARRTPTGQKWSCHLWGRSDHVETT